MITIVLEKVTYKDQVTVIYGKNMNEIQDAVIANQKAIESLQDQAPVASSTIVDATVE